MKTVDSDYNKMLKDTDTPTYTESINWGEQTFNKLHSSGGSAK